MFDQCAFVLVFDCPANPQFVEALTLLHDDRTLNTACPIVVAIRLRSWGDWWTKRPIVRKRHLVEQAWAHHEQDDPIRATMESRFDESKRILVECLAFVE